MAIYCIQGKYAIRCVRRGIMMTYTTKSLQEAQEKHREMTEDTVVELSLRRYYFHPDKILELHYPLTKDQ
jgi:hypothetical protein